MPSIVFSRPAWGINTTPNAFTGHPVKLLKTQCITRYNVLLPVDSGREYALLGTMTA